MIVWNVVDCANGELAKNHSAGGNEIQVASLKFDGGFGLWVA